MTLSVPKKKRNIKGIIATLIWDKEKGYWCEQKENQLRILKDMYKNGRREIMY